MQARIIGVASAIVVILLVAGYLLLFGIPHPECFEEKDCRSCYTDYYIAPLSLRLGEIEIARSNAHAEVIGCLCAERGTYRSYNQVIVDYAYENYYSDSLTDAIRQWHLHPENRSYAYHAQFGTLEKYLNATYVCGSVRKWYILNETGSAG
ncbi:hypothetical protein JXB02_04575 [Candidatus Woesearchaeota archaeon]|nr:hypothetical protein [Candidatus Woesearchaeota archaeon]